MKEKFDTDQEDIDGIIEGIRLTAVL